MADDYIDYWEVGEYNDHFQVAVQRLSGLSALVNMAAIAAYVDEGAKAVKVELDRTGLKRSTLRTGAVSIDDAAEALRREIEKLWNYLRSLDDDSGVDLAAFFPGEKLGTLAALKPADVKSKADEVLRGFLVPENQVLPEFDKRQGKLTAARDTLADALAGRSGARGESVEATAQLVAAREEFLVRYNGVAKPILRGVLASLGRKDDHDQFFADLLAKESGGTQPSAPAKPATGG